MDCGIFYFKGERALKVYMWIFGVAFLDGMWYKFVWYIAIINFWRFSKMKMKLIAFTLAMVIALGLAGCGTNNTEGGNPSDTTTPKEVAENNETNTTPQQSDNNLTIENLLLLPESSQDLFDYVENEKGLIITGIREVDEIIIIPSKIDGKDVTGISKANYNGIKAIVVPETVSIIGSSAFERSPDLEIVYFKGDSDLTMGGNVFMACRKLETIRLPDGMTEIGEGAFMECTSLKNIDLPRGLKVIKNGAFFQSGLENVILPDGLETIEGSAFSLCDNLLSCVVPASVNSMEYNSFGSHRSQAFTIITPSGSYAEQFANENEIKVENN
jgi:hypothetical protein